MSDTEYTPTDGQLRMAWITQRWNQAGQIRSEGSDDEFDRWLAAHDAELAKLVRAEQRDAEGLYRLQAAARLLSDLDRNDHGRHQGDIDSFDPTGISRGNPHLVSGQTIGYDIGGAPYVVPEPRERGVVKAWTAAIREASDD